MRLGFPAISKIFTSLSITIVNVERSLIIRNNIKLRFFLVPNSVKQITIYCSAEKVIFLRKQGNPEVMDTGRTDRISVVSSRNFLLGQFQFSEKRKGDTEKTR